MRNQSSLVKIIGSIAAVILVFVFIHNVFSSQTFTSTGNQSATVEEATSSSTSVTLDPTLKVSTLPPESPQNYVDNKNGTITDKDTGLIWAKCSQGLSGSNCTTGSPVFLEWSKARTTCEGLTLGGKSQWRLPTLKELESVVDTTQRNPAMNQKYFVGSQNAYWTLTSPVLNPTAKFTVLFSDGSVYFESTGLSAAMRCVYDGKSN